VNSGIYFSSKIQVINLLISNNPMVKSCKTAPDRVMTIKDVEAITNCLC